MSSPSKIQNPRFKIGQGRTYGIVAIAIIAFVAALQMRPHRAESQLPAHPTVNIPPIPATSAPAKSASVPAATTGVLTLIGTLQANQAALSVIQPARIVGVDVHEGDSVRQGQLLIRLDAAQGEAQERTAAAGVEAARVQLAKATEAREAQRVRADSDVQTARAGLQQAQDKLLQAVHARDAAQAEQQADLAAAQENVRKAQLGLDQAKQNLHSLEELNSVGGVARNDLEGARTQAATAQSDLDQAQAQVRRLQAGPPGGAPFRIELAQQDAQAAQHGVQQARAGVATALRARTAALQIAERDIQAAAAGVRQAKAGQYGARAAVQMSTLASPYDGIAAALNAHVGETAQPGVPLVTIVEQKNYRIEALATARQLPRLHPGQRAAVTLDTQPDKGLEAEITSLSRIAEPDGRSFRIRLRFISSANSLKPGQSVRITFTRN
jgi:multidrug resistance efflux pump